MSLIHGTCGGYDGGGALCHSMVHVVRMMGEVPLQPCVTVMVDCWHWGNSRKVDVVANKKQQTEK